jgi:hypothetical protein
MEALRQILDEVALAPTEAVRELALMKPIRLFLTTNLDRALENALRIARGTEPISISFAPNRPVDLPDAYTENEQAIVFHMTGASEAGSFSAAITEADWLEFSSALVNWDREPRRLLEAMDGRRLLFLGGGHPTGFVRALIHLASVGREVQAWIGASALDGDGAIPNLLRARGSRDRLFDDDGGELFISQLRRRWEAWQNDTGRVQASPSVTLETNRPIVPVVPAGEPQTHNFNSSPCIEPNTPTVDPESPWLGLHPLHRGRARILLWT